MDTKSKKRRTIAGFAAFFLGVSFLLTSGALLLSQGIAADWSGGGFSEITESDYQNTREFRSYVQERLSNFLVMATGGEIGAYYDSDGFFWGAYDEVVYGSGTGTVTYNAAGAAAEAIQEQYDTAWEEDSASSGTDSNASRKKTKEENEADAKAYHESIRENKNLRYRIVCDGEEKYSNMDDLAWDGESAPLPEGYNFLLHFDGEKVTITKDGVELDVYGDGYYRSDSQWYVPGYRNFAIDTEMKKVEITMLAAKEPVYYSYVKYGEDGYVRTESMLYYIAEDLKQSRRDFCRGIAGLAVGIVFSVIHLMLRREKKEAGIAVSRFTGKIWFEGKLLVLLFLLAGLRGIFRNPYFSEITAAYAFDSSWDSTYDLWTEMGYSMSELWYGLVSRMAQHPFFLLLFFWLAWLLVNDIRENRGHFFDGAIRRLVRTARTAGLKQSFSVQVMRRFLLVTFVGIVFAASILLLCLAASFGVTNDVETGLAGLFLLAAALAAYYRCLCKAKRQAVELDLLADSIAAVHDGDYSEKEGAQEDSALKPLFDQIAEIRQGMETAVGERLRSERMKVELVANVSHDIKTPLTSIISYVQFLKQEEGLPEHVKDYIRILDEKSERLNNMVQDVFAVSKAASGQLPVELKELDFGKLLRQTLADMEEQIQKSVVTVKAEIPEQAVLILADGGKMYRVFQNLILNALKYSLDGSRVFVTLTEKGGEAAACVKNTSRQELRAVADFTERFVRGDESRTDGGTGLGLSIAKSFTEACGGRFALETNADLFVVTVAFPRK